MESELQFEFVLQLQSLGQLKAASCELLVASHGKGAWLPWLPHASLDLEARPASFGACNAQSGRQKRAAAL